jgi:hypothetical protein
VKIALCIPCHGDTKAKFTQCLAAMIAHTLGARIEMGGEPVKIEFETFIVSCSLLPESRNRLVAEAIHWEADYMLWMDADHVFPCDALLRLLSRNKLVVGCNYARRFNPTSPTASKYGTDNEADLVWTTEEKARGDVVEEVAHLGLGLCLVDMRTYAILEAKATEEGKEHFWPLFRMDPTEDGIRFIGEDVHYFKMIREAGIPVFCDHALSWELGHEFGTLLMNAHTVVQKDKWIEWRKSKLDKFKGRENGN